MNIVKMFNVLIRYIAFSIYKIIFWYALLFECLISYYKYLCIMKKKVLLRLSFRIPFHCAITFIFTSAFCVYVISLINYLRFIISLISYFLELIINDLTTRNRYILTLRICWVTEYFTLKLWIALWRRVSLIV